MLTLPAELVIGIDPDRDNITAAIVTASTGALVATSGFETTAAGYQDLQDWADNYSETATRRWSIEGSASYGAGATATLIAAGETVEEFDHPRTMPSPDGSKNDTLDAIRAAREAAGRQRMAQPRARGQRQQLQSLMVARNGAKRARSAAINELKALVVTGPVELRDELRQLSRTKLIARCSRLRPNPTSETKLALRSIARRIEHLDTEIVELDTAIAPLVDELAPQLLDEIGISYTTAATIIVAWSHHRRIHSEAAFARFAGTSPLEASSGNNTRHRLNRQGNRQLNAALHQIAITRTRHDPATRTYIERRTNEGKTPREIRRCLKRYIARHIYRILENPPNTTT